MAYTVLDLLTASLNIIGSYGTGESPNADDAAVAFFELNAMLDSWNTERINLFTVLEYIATLTPTQQEYSIGPSASNFSTSFSVTQIQSAACIIPSSTARLPLSIINSTQFAAIQERGIQGAFPDRVYFDYQYPIGNLFFYPVPNQSVSIDFFFWSILQAFTSYTQAVQMRPGYQKSLEWNLAVALYSRFGLTPDPLVLQLAATYKQNMQQLNASSGLATALSSSTTLNMPTEGIPPPTPQGAPNQ